MGLVETHGRTETAQLLEGLELLPPRVVAYQGRELREFDLDAALARKPALILVDELAHSNVAGSRHPKRWQDVEELLAAGIDVWTTVNVQHLESLNDIVGGITGIQVRETLPDRVFERADEVTLVDLTPDELLQRMKEGKVYLAQQAERAIRNFFRKGNLIALRELALRRTADRVDAQMREYRSDQAIREVWEAKERLLVCLGPGAGGDRLVRAAARLAGKLHADWIAVYVETPRLQRLSEADRDKILRTLTLAQELGAETVTLAGQEDAPTLLAYAVGRNVSKLVVGKSLRTGLSRMLRAPLSDRLSALADDIDVYVVAHEAEAPAPGKAISEPFTLDQEPAPKAQWLGYVWAGGVCALATVLAHGGDALVRSGQHHHALPAGRGRGGGSLRAGPGHPGLLPFRAGVRFLLCVATTLVQRGRHPPSPHLRHHAGSRPDHQQRRRQPALSDARRPLPRTPHPCAQRTGAGAGGGAAAGKHRRHVALPSGRAVPVPGLHPAAGRPGKTACAHALALAQGTAAGSGDRPVGLRPPVAGRDGHPESGRARPCTTCR